MFLFTKYFQLTRFIVEFYQEIPRKRSKLLKLNIDGKNILILLFFQAFRESIDKFLKLFQNKAIYFYSFVFKSWNVSLLI